MIKVTKKANRKIRMAIKNITEINFRKLYKIKKN